MQLPAVWPVVKSTEAGVPCHPQPQVPDLSEDGGEGDPQPQPRAAAQVVDHGQEGQLGDALRHWHVAREHEGRHLGGTVITLKTHE